MTEITRLCRDCKWVERWVPVSWHLRDCNHPKAETDLVGGNKPFASIERMRSDYGKHCGPRGAWWEKY